jgi:hypothetical protein
MDVGDALVGRMSVRLERVMRFRRSPSRRERSRLTTSHVTTPFVLEAMPFFASDPQTGSYVTVVTVRISRPAN